MGQMATNYNTVYSQCYVFSVSTSQKKAVLEWIFAYYDGDGNDELSKTELVYGRGRRDMHNFFGCTKFLEPFYEMVDENANDAVVLSEWLGFFDSKYMISTANGTMITIPNFFQLNYRLITVAVPPTQCHSKGVPPTSRDKAGGAKEGVDFSTP